MNEWRILRIIFSKDKHGRLIGIINEMFIFVVNLTQIVLHVLVCHYKFFVNFVE